MDDLLVGAGTICEINDVAAQLSNPFDMKILRSDRFIFGVEVKYLRDDRRLQISQRSCISRMVEQFNQVDSR